jgi:hypothetical protein
MMNPFASANGGAYDRAPQQDNGYFGTAPSGPHQYDNTPMPAGTGMYGGGGMPGTGAYGIPEPNAGYNTQMVFNPMKWGWFVAALCVAVGGAVGAIWLFFTLSWVDTLNMIYMFLFGLIMAALDRPILPNWKFGNDMQRWISKYAALLARLTGKGMCYIFVGSTLFSSLFTNIKQQGVGAWLGGLMNLFVIIIGVISLAMGAMNTNKLRKAQELLQHGVLETQYGNFAKKYPVTNFGPASGITKQEFNELTQQYGGASWEPYDLDLIFNALGNVPEWLQEQDGEPKLTKEEMLGWVNGGSVWL